MSILDALKTEDKTVGKVLGVVAGIVTDNRDPDGLGRVKVKFPWLSGSNETDWVRISTLMAGGERGSFFLPEAEDEVLIAFEHGDMNRPYVIGALWNVIRKPPESNRDGKNNIRKIRSRSGHEIIFDDNSSAGQEKVEIHTKAGHTIVLDDSVGREKIEIVDKTGSNSIVIDSVKNSIAISASLQVKIKAAAVEIEADSMLTIKAGAILTLQGSLVKIN